MTTNARNHSLSLKFYCSSWAIFILCCLRSKTFPDSFPEGMNKFLWLYTLPYNPGQRCSIPLAFHYSLNILSFFQAFHLKIYIWTHIYIQYDFSYVSLNMSIQKIHLFQIMEAKKCWTWSEFAWEIFKEYQDHDAEKSSAKTPLNISCLKTPRGLHNSAMSWRHFAPQPALHRNYSVTIATHWSIFHMQTVNNLKFQKI